MKVNNLFFIILAVLFTLPVSGQKSEKKIAITGIVTDVAKNPVEGVQIFIDSVKTDFTSDASGKYKVKVSPSAKTIFINTPYRGFATDDINGRTKIDFVLGGINKERPSFVTVSSDDKNAKSDYDPEELNSYTDIFQMIRQKVPGVVVSGRSIVVRGPNSFFGSSAPLYIVNEVVVSSIDNIMPTQVKSIKLLTGASASMYGNQGANGVLKITLINGSGK